jgi:hypothetical protein
MKDGSSSSRGGSDDDENNAGASESDDGGDEQYYAAFSDLNLQLEIAICDAPLDNMHVTANGAPDTLTNAEKQRSNAEKARGCPPDDALNIVTTQSVSAGAEIHNTYAAGVLQYIGT